jgi:hypothetical protein
LCVRIAQLSALYEGRQVVDKLEPLDFVGAATDLSRKRDRKPIRQPRATASKLLPTISQQPCVSTTAYSNCGKHSMMAETSWIDCS